MNIRKTVLYLVAALAVLTLLAGCRISFSFSGASIHPDAKTVSIAYIPNNAPMVAPLLSPTLTDAIKDRFQRQTRLTEVPENGDIAIEGEITGYTSTPSSISTLADGSDGAVRNRLTITVKIRINNVYEPHYNVNDRSFSAYLDYDSNQLLTEVENSLIPEIVDMLVDDIFNAAVANW
ncbi:MAG: LPS assembly lipoprotein LptE [Alistipes sp.]|nr:LPS assembly lipoprotein LptE [Alistipes sp.]